VHEINSIAGQIKRGADVLTLRAAWNFHTPPENLHREIFTA